MDEAIETEHIQYQNGILFIDQENIKLPDGDKLNIKYRAVNGVVTFVVKVDGEIITKRE